MGGSLAGAIKKYLPRSTVIGFDIDTTVATNARSNKILDNIENTFDKLVNSADILFLATPVSSVLQHINSLHSYSKRMIISDMCSIKRPVMKAAKTLSGDMTFIGGHPMAGSHKSGIEHADPDLFQNAVYVLCTPVTGHIPDDLLTLVTTIGAHPVILQAEMHDKTVSQISHVPQLLAVAILNELRNNAGENAVAYELAAGGFKDVTRIGESAYSVWKDILDENKDNIISDLSTLIIRLNMYKEALQRVDFSQIETEFQNARETRKNLKSHSKKT